MTLTARAREVVQQTDSTVVQVVRILNNGVPVKDVQFQYQAGADQASAVGNLTAVVKAALARQASDGTSVAVAPLTALDLTDPVVTPPVQPPAGFAAWQAKWSAYLQLARWQSQGVPSATSVRVAQAKADHEALWDASFEAFLL